MANKRTRGGRVYYRVKHKLLHKPLYVSFTDEAKGDEYVERLEALLDNGVVPKSVQQRTAPKELRDISAVIDGYVVAAHPPESDELLLQTVKSKIGSTRLPLDMAWAEKWVAELKDERLAPSTIRHQVGALARGLDWLVRTRPEAQVVNPLRMLPKRYATHRDAGVVDEERDRRLEPGEEVAIRRVLAGWKPPDRERGVTVEPDMTLLFDLALESAMRLREMFTLTPDQVSIPRRTIYLDKTKNGDSRQVPLTTVAAARLEGFAGFRWVQAPGGRELRRVTSLLSRRFGTVFELAGCSDLHFHDLRHEATCRLYERTALSDVQIARITGHKDLRTLRRYASLRGSDLAGKLW
jgi:integrase